MNGYNDYISITRRWMKDYNTFKATVENMTADILEQQKLLSRSDDLVAPIAKYGGMPQGGTPELNSVEAQAYDRMRREASIYRQILNRDEIKRIIDRIDRAIRTLPLEDQAVLKEHYIDGQSWETIGYARNYSERWAREKGGRALKAVAFVLFGVKARPEQLTFVFAG